MVLVPIKNIIFIYGYRDIGLIEFLRVHSMSGSMLAI